MAVRASAKPIRMGRNAGATDRRPNGLAGRTRKSERWTPLAVAAAVVAVTWVAFFPVVTCKFINYDDPRYITENPHVLSGLSIANIRYAFTTSIEYLYHPLSTVSLMLDAQLFGKSPVGFHAVNAFIHSLNAAAVFLLFWLPTRQRWRSAAVALLFAVHPLRVESVAWASERKDVLALFFSLLALIAYAQWSRLRQARWLVLLGAAVIAGQFSKPVLITLPALMFLLDYWPLRRFGREPVAQGGLAASVGHGEPVKKPWWLLALPKVVGTIALLLWTLKVQQFGADEVAAKGMHFFTEPAPLAVRIQNAVVSYARYLVKHVQVTDLAIPYPMSHSGWSVPVTAAASALLLGVTVLAIFQWRRRPWVMVGWLWFVIALAPLIGIVYIADYSLADRYTYLADIGLMAAAVWTVPAQWAAAPRGRTLLPTAFAAVLVTLIGFTWAQIGYWRDSATLFMHAIEKTDGNYLAEYNLGMALVDEKAPEKAIPHFRKATEYNRNFSSACYNLASALLTQNDVEGAAAAYGEAARIDPDMPDALVGLGATLSLLHRPAEAIAAFRKAIAVRPDDVNAHINLGAELEATGSLAEADAEYREAARRDPHNADAHYNLGVLLLKQDRPADAAVELRAALFCNPSGVDAHVEYATALGKLGRYQEAMEEFREAARLAPEREDARKGFFWPDPTWAKPRRTTDREGPIRRRRGRRAAELTSRRTTTPPDNVFGRV